MANCKKSAIMAQTTSLHALVVLPAAVMPKQEEIVEFARVLASLGQNVQTTVLAGQVFPK